MSEENKKGIMVSKTKTYSMVAPPEFMAYFEKVIATTMENLCTMDFKHLRDANNRMFATICTMRKKGKTMAVGISFCSDKDNFSRKIGRKIAMSRAIKALSSRLDHYPINRSNCTVIDKWYCTTYYSIHDFKNKSIYLGGDE